MKEKKRDENIDIIVIDFSVKEKEKSTQSNPLSLFSGENTIAPYSSNFFINSSEFYYS